MPRNHDEAVEWPDEAYKSLSEVILRLELNEQFTNSLEESDDPESPQDDC